MRQLARRAFLYLVGVRIRQGERQVGSLRVVEIDITLPRWMGADAAQRIARRIMDSRTDADVVSASALRIRREHR